METIHQIHVSLPENSIFLSALSPIDANNNENIHKCRVDGEDKHQNAFILYCNLVRFPAFAINPHIDI